MEKWDQRFFNLAEHISNWSKDRSTRVGAVIVGPHREIRSTGYNGFPPGVDDEVEARHERPTKYLYAEHAERNAIYFAASTGVIIAGCTIYVTMFPCADCARGIIRSGIRRVVAPMPSRSDWAASHEAARTMFREASVDVLECELVIRT